MRAAPSGVIREAAEEPVWVSQPRPEWNQIEDWLAEMAILRESRVMAPLLIPLGVGTV